MKRANSTSKTKKTTTTKTAKPATATKKATAAKSVAVKATAPAKAKTAAASKAAPAKAKAAPQPARILTTETIAARAYTLWEKDGRPNGRDAYYWFQAENQLKQETQSFAE